MCVLKSVKIHLKLLGCMPVGIDFIQLPFCHVKIPFDLLHITCIFTILIGNMVATFWYYIREVKTFADFSESVFWGSRSVLSLVLYTLLICRKTKLVQFFHSLDEIANTRKCFIRIFIRETIWPARQSIYVWQIVYHHQHWDAILSTTLIARFCKKSTCNASKSGGYDTNRARQVRQFRMSVATLTCMRALHLQDSLKCLIHWAERAIGYMEDDVNTAMITIFFQAIKMSYFAKFTVNRPIVNRLSCNDASASIHLLAFQYCMSFRLLTNHIMRTTPWIRRPLHSNYSIKLRMYHCHRRIFVLNLIIFFLTENEHFIT